MDEQIYKGDEEHLGRRRVRRAGSTLFQSA
jgi:hypothetical protein